MRDLLAPFDADEWSSPSGRRMDLPMRGNVLSVPMQVKKTGGGRLRGWARFRRFHLGRNGAVHGGAVLLTPASSGSSFSIGTMLR